MELYIFIISSIKDLYKILFYKKNINPRISKNYFGKYFNLKIYYMKNKKNKMIFICLCFSCLACNTRKYFLK